MKHNHRYQWDWKTLSLWREEDHKWQSGDITFSGGSSDRVFTLYPPWLLPNLRDWLMWRCGFWPNPNPYWHFEAFEARWKKEHPKSFLSSDDPDEFYKILNRYSMTPEPGSLVSLEPHFLK